MGAERQNNTKKIMEDKETKNVSIRVLRDKEDFTSGKGGHLICKRMGLGSYVPAIGYYKLVEVKNKPTDKKESQPVCAYFNSESPNNFKEERVTFEAKFLFNKMSIGNKNITLKEGMIIQIERTSLVTAYYDGKPYDTYQIEWKLINGDTPSQTQTNNEFYPEDYLDELNNSYLDEYDF